MRTDKSKEFVNKTFQDTLKYETIEFVVYENPEVKCSVNERAQLTIREWLNQYFTYRKSYRYIDLLPKFVTAYNDTVHTINGIAQSKVTDSDIITIWKRMKAKRRSMHTVKA